MAACRKRAAVLRSLAIQRSDSPGIRALSQAVSRKTQTATRIERTVAVKATALIRGFVQTSTFDELVLVGIAEIKRHLQKGGFR
jgi:stage V sporulation protein SpoVS